MRTQLSQKHIRGSGIEIGALHCPTHVEPSVKVTYVDVNPLLLKKNHGDVLWAISDWVVDDAETLLTFEDHSQDFIIAHHVFEHLENPILAIKNWARVLKPGGVIMAAIPDCRYTFDRSRTITSFWHLIQDYERGPQISLEDHYRDWFTNAEVEDKGKFIEARVALAMKEHANIHFHVWDAVAIFELFHELKKFAPLEDIQAHQNGAEVIVICRKKT